MPAPLTLLDLEAVLADDRHLGWGYACSQSLPRSLRARLDSHVIRRANAEGLDRELLFHWANSKYGRYLCDAVGSRPTSAELRERVARYLSREIALAMYEEREPVV